MIRIESHPEYMTLQLSLLDLRLSSVENEQAIGLKQSLVKSIPSPDPVRDIKIAALKVLESQNAQVTQAFETYFAETQQALTTTERSLDYISEGKFQSKVNAYLAQLELLATRIKSGATSTSNLLEIFPCKGKWCVADSTSLDILGEFDSLQDAETYAKSLRRKWRITQILATL